MVRYAATPANPAKGKCAVVLFLPNVLIYLYFD